MNYEIQNGVLTFKFQYNPTASNINEFLKYMYQIIDTKEIYDEVVMDFSEVQYVDSTGITFLIGIYRYLSKMKKSFRIINARKEIVDLFEIVNMTNLFQVNY
ncbi:MAG: anti-sigma factor antagonist [Tindallia sp. MSAO_Bac2]|nr:MAG: anti-sigma factor antagonist [Tindallia sp. MSAO_Bac2]